jgi:hypothetical protein
MIAPRGTCSSGSAGKKGRPDNETAGRGNSLNDTNAPSPSYEGWEGLPAATALHRGCDPLREGAGKPAASMAWLTVCSAPARYKTNPGTGKAGYKGTLEYSKLGCSRWRSSLKAELIRHDPQADQAGGFSAMIVLALWG